MSSSNQNIKSTFDIKKKFGMKNSLVSNGKNIMDSYKSTGNSGKSNFPTDLEIEQF